MKTKSRVSLVVALAVCVAPSAMAHSRTHHAGTRHASVTHPYRSAYPYTAGYQWLPGPGYAAPLPTYAPYGGWACVTDEGQGRFLPCDMGGS